MKNIKKYPLFILLSFIGSVSTAMEIGDARHLWSRTGFAKTDLLINHYANLSIEQAIDAILNTPLSVPKQELLPHFDKKVYLKLRSKEIPKKVKQQIRRTLVKVDREKLQHGWYQQILSSNNRLQEKMTVFWHNHFTSSLKKVLPPYMLMQNQIFRENALGNFSQLLSNVMFNPAIHMYLDNNKNKKNKPNENLARELLELFTLGESHYSEQDIKNIAKSLTGYYINNKRQLMLSMEQHDRSKKTILGQTADYDLSSVLRLILAQPQTAQFITEKLWREFISETPDPKALKHLAAVFRQSNYNIKVLLRAILTSNHFWDQHNRNNLVKSPVDLLISTAYFLGYPPVTLDKLPVFLKRSGQDLFYPPDVRGWRGGKYWLDADLIINRKQFLQKYVNLSIKSQPKILKQINQRLNADYQFFAIGKQIPHHIKNPKQRIHYLLLNDYYNFK